MTGAWLMLASLCTLLFVAANAGQLLARVDRASGGPSTARASAPIAYEFLVLAAAFAFLAVMTL